MPKVTIISANTEIENSGKIRCAAYCRVSSSSEDQLNSYAAQIRYYSSVFEGSETEELVDVYADEGITGTSEEKRDEFKRLISDCKKGKIDRIYTKSISRYARNTKDCLKSIRLLKALGVTIYFEKENIDTAKMSDEMMITIMGGLAQEESTSISQNQKWSVRKRMQNGSYQAPSIAYGYKKEDGKIVIDEPRAKMVKQIFEWYLSGIGVTTITAELNKRNVPPSMYGKQWCNFAVSYILTNERYVGDMLLQKTYSTDTMPIRKEVNKGEKPKYLIKGSHDPIISKEDFERVQKLIKGKSIQFRGKAEDNSPFSGVIKCGCCGESCKRKKRNGQYFIVCRRHDNNAADCRLKALAEKDIKQTFIAMSNKLILHYKEILIPLQRGLNDLNSIRHQGNSRVLDLHKEIAGIKEQKHVIARLRKKGFMDEKKYNEQLAAFDGKIKRLENELKKIANTDEHDETMEQLDLLISCIESKNSVLTEFDDEMFSEIIDRLVINDSTITFHLINELELVETY